MLRYYRFMFVVVLLMAGCANSNDTDSDNEPQLDVVAMYHNSPLSYVPASNFPIVGSANAKAKFDIFFDPWCGPCRFLDQQVFQLLADKDYANQVSFQFHLFPLGETEKQDQEACLLYLEMVKRNLYEPFKKKVVDDNIGLYDDMLKIAESLAKTKLPSELLKKNNLKDLKQAVEVVRSLHLGHTPTVFLNDREVPTTPTLKDFRLLIDSVTKN